MSANGNVLVPGNAQPPRAGYDHDWFAWSALPTRPELSASVERKLHVVTLVDLGAVEWEDSADTTRRPRPTGGRGVYPAPDFPRLSHREFGHRVGIFHVLEMANALGLSPTVAMDALTAVAYPQLAEHVAGNASEIVAHGLSASRPITSDLSIDEERDYIAQTLEALSAYQPTGWLGPEFSHSLHTPQLLADAGIRYLCDWSNDDEPYPTEVTGPNGVLWMHPHHTDLADINVMFGRKVLPWDYADRLYEAAAALSAESTERPRVLTIVLSAWLSGQAHVIAPIRDALQRITTELDVVTATPTQTITAWQN